jgi:dTDP-L-rhamnose 4-epimerase
MRVLVTGGAGFIGSHITDALLDAGHEVVVVDSLHPAAHQVAPEGLDRRADHRWHSVTDQDALTHAVRGCDAVCHQAAMVGLGVDFGDVVDYVTENDLGTAALLRVLHDQRFRGRIVIAGSMVVYGEGRYRCGIHGLVEPAPRDPALLTRGIFDPPCPQCGGDLVSESVPESAAVDPRNVYAATKLHQEHLGAAYAIEHPDVTVTALRYHNVYGPRMPRNTPYAGVASIFRSALERGEAPTVFEDGAQRRDFVHVRDVARANVLALTAPVPVAGPVNVASGHPHTVLDAATALTAAFDRPELTPEVVGTWRAGDVRHVVASTERARDQLGFVAEVGFEAGMAEFATAPLRAS